MYSTPEDATAYRGIYLDCSSYVNSIYYNLFGVDVVTVEGYSRVDTYIMNYYAETEWAKGDNKASDVIYFVNTQDYTTQDAKNALLQEILSNLEVGDLIVYRHGATSGSSGHVMLYVGNDTILHCTGSSFAINETNPMSAKDNATTIEAKNGAIQIATTSDVFTNTSSSRYLFNSGATSSANKVWTFAILRPLNNNWKLTDTGKARGTILGLSIEKTSDAPHMSSVVSGDTITYTISLVNKGETSVTGITVTDEVSDLVTLNASSITNNGTYNNSTITWEIEEIQKGEAITLSYSVTVKDNVTPGEVIDSSSATINGIKTNKLYHVISNSIDYDKLEENILALSSNSTYSDFREAVYTAYQGIISEDVLESFLPSKTLLYSLLHTDSGYMVNLTHASKPILLPDFYGGLWMQFKDSNQVRLVKNEYLKTGDIILTRYNDSSDNKIYTAYLYVNSSTIIQIDSSGNVSNIITSSYTSDLFLVQLIGYKLYAILRPSMINNLE